MHKVLVVDDSKFDRLMIVSALNSVFEDVNCVEVANSASALERIRLERPCLTILDIRMPEVSGWDVLAQIKADVSLKNAKVVMMTGVSSEEDILKASQSGAHGFYKKPNKRSDYVSVATDIKKSYFHFAA